MSSRPWSFIRRPRLHVYFDPATTYLMRDVVDAGGAPGYFCHVMVRNSGRATARNCRGRLLEVSVRDLERDQPRALDLCFTLASSPQQLRFFAPPSPSGVQIFPPGVYTVRVTVMADNMRAIQGVFRIDFTRGWNQIVVEEGG